MTKILRLATRGSRLARWQTDHVIAQLDEHHTDLATEIVEIATTGDIIKDVPLSQVGSSAFFTREIEVSLLDGEVDVAVHSLKDLAAKDVPGLRIAAVLVREDPRDALVSRGAPSLDALASGARVGTSSVRRKALLTSIRPDLELLELRGNVPTRVRKLDEGGYDAIVLAVAGLERLGMGDRITERLDLETFVPAAGQGAIALQIRADDEHAASLVTDLGHSDTRHSVDAERAFLAELEVGCQAPVGVHARIHGAVLQVWAMVASTDGSVRLDARVEGSPDSAEELGRRLADDMREKGGVRLLDDARGHEVAQ